MALSVELRVDYDAAELRELAMTSFSSAENTRARRIATAAPAFMAHPR